MENWKYIIQCSVTVVLLVSSLCGNIMVIIGTGLYTSMSIDKITMWFVQCLSVIDVCTSCTMLFYFIGIFSDFDTSNLGSLIHSVFWSLIMIEAYIISLMAFHRFVSLVKPLQLLVLRKRKLWLPTAIISMVSLALSFAKEFTQEGKKVLKSALNCLYLFLALVLPLSILLIALVGVRITLDRIRSKNNLQCENPPIRFGERVKCSLFGALMHRNPTGSKCVFKKGAVLLFAVGVSFIVTMIPMQVVMIMETMFLFDFEDLWIYINQVYIFGTAINPFIYSAMSRNFRSFLMSTLRCKTHRSHFKRTSITTSA